MMDWPILRDLLQFLVLPALVFVWGVYRQVNGLEREILRIVTILEEREKHSLENRADVAAALRDLHAAIKDLRADLAKVAERP